MFYCPLDDLIVSLSVDFLRMDSWLIGTFDVCREYGLTTFAIFCINLGIWVQHFTRLSFCWLR